MVLVLLGLFGSACKQACDQQTACDEGQRCGEDGFCAPDVREGEGDVAGEGEQGEGEGEGGEGEGEEGEGEGEGGGCWPVCGNTEICSARGCVNRCVDLYQTCDTGAELGICILEDNNSICVPSCQPDLCIFSGDTCLDLSGGFQPPACFRSCEDDLLCVISGGNGQCTDVGVGSFCLQEPAENFQSCGNRPNRGCITGECRYVKGTAARPYVFGFCASFCFEDVDCSSELVCSDDLLCVPPSQPGDRCGISEDGTATLCSAGQECVPELLDPFATCQLVAQ
jgi:hypothetical protein